MTHHLLPNLLHFVRLLHAAGLDVPAGRMQDVAAALEHVEVGKRQDFYFTLRSLLVHRPQDRPVFDEAFALFWRPPPVQGPFDGPRPMRRPRRTDAPEAEMASDDPAGSSSSVPVLDRVVPLVVPTSASAREVSRVADFAALTDEERKQTMAVLSELEWDLDRRRTRRWAPGKGTTVDLRRLARRNLRFGGEPMELPTRRRIEERRTLVLIADVSGSMERYARMVLYFVYGLVRGLTRVEVFLFATRLTRVTHELTRLPFDAVVPAIPRRLPDWGGGTRIGEALRVFNVRWARRVLGHGPVVLLISDGWDRGDPELVAREMSRLQRSSHRLIWLNPLLGSPDYQPLTRGMRAALPFVDDFMPVHNLSSLEALAAHLGALPSRRSGRRTGGVRPQARPSR